MTSTANRPVVSTASGRRRNKSGNPLVDAYLAHCNTRNAAPSSVVLAALSNATTTAPSNASTLASASASGSAPAKAPVSAHHKTDGNIFGGATIQLNADLVPREEEWEGLFQALRGGTGIDGIHIWSNHIDERRKAERTLVSCACCASEDVYGRRPAHAVTLSRIHRARQAEGHSCCVNRGKSSQWCGRYDEGQNVGAKDSSAAATARHSAKRKPRTSGPSQVGLERGWK